MQINTHVSGIEKIYFIVECQLIIVTYELTCTKYSGEIW